MARKTNASVTAPVTSNTAAGSNLGPVKAEMLVRIEDLGRQEGAGLNSRPELALEVALAASQGLIQIGDGAKDVHEIWEKFSEARSGAKYDGGKDNAASFKAQVSKLGNFAKCGALALKATPVDGVEVLRRAREIIKNSQDLKLSAYDALIKVANKQWKESGEAALTDAEIREVLSGPAKQDETDDEVEARKLTAMLKSMEALKKGSENAEAFVPARPSPELDAAIEQIRTRLAQLTTFVKQAQAQRELEQAQAKAAAAGLKLAA